MAASGSTARLKQAVRTAALLLAGGTQDFDPLLDRIGDAQVVLIGEASHGTHEFYDVRERITRRLIEEKGFTGVAIEGDWPDAHRVDRYVRHQPGDATGEAALAGFDRFPVWMWRNTEMLEFVEWVRRRNASAGAGRMVGIHGLDLYSLEESADAVVDYLRGIDPAAAQRARRRYDCFNRYGNNPERYAASVGLGSGASCAKPSAEQVREIEQRMAASGSADDALFSAHRNARVVVNAERYYRSMAGGESSWNLRDTHMMDTLQALVQRRHGDRPARIVVWAHNSHVGDARATEMGQRGELNLGQLARQRYGGKAVLVGFSTYQGSVRAASDWDAPGQHKRVRPGLPESYEALFHDTGLPAFQLRLGDAALQGLSRPRLQRAIGVVYRPETERASHYFNTVVTQQFDWMIHIDTTRALEPLPAGKRPARAARTARSRATVP